MRPPMAARRSADEKAVSEIMGVTMLLAMVITTMAGLIVPSFRRFERVDSDLFPIGVDRSQSG